MKAKKYLLSDEQKEKTVESIKNTLNVLPEIVFAYIHGSFINTKGFGDIDIAVYLKEETLRERSFIINYEIDLEMKLEETLKYPVDVRVLNYAPLSFQYQVIKGGELVFEKDGDSRVDFQTKTLDFYFDFAPFRKRYLKEVLGLGN